jgi:hypothetical protein
MRSRESISLSLISAASLAYEICLTRIFAVQQFHNFAFIVISLAVMGYAASGVALSLSRVQPRRLMLVNSFAIAAMLAYLVINYLPFDSFSIAWDRSQVWILLLYFLAAGLPFLFAGWFIGQALLEAGESAFRPYAANLIGASLGCLIALASLQLTSEEGALGISIALGLLTAAIIAPRRRLRVLYVLLASAVFVVFLRPIANLQLNLSPYKPLSIAKQFPGAQVLATERNASARVDILESSGIHSYPGLSLTSPAPDLDQIGLYIDGEGPFPITNADIRSKDNLAFAYHMPSGVAYMLRPDGRALIIDPGTGLSAQVALALGAEHVTIPTDQPLIVNLLRREFRAASGDIFNDERIQLIPRSSRGALRLEDAQYTIVEWALSDPYRPITSGAFSLTENYILTQEAFEQGWQRLLPDGLIVITRWIGTPPSEAARVWSTILHALAHQGLSDPGSHLVAFRGMRTATILISKQPFGGEELKVIREFLVLNALDPIYLPDLGASEINHYNRLPEPVYHQLFSALLETPDNTIHNYDFRLEPPSDDRPYFFHFFRWVQSSQILDTLGVLWQPFGGSGYFVLLAMLALILLLATPLVLLPWLSLRRDPHRRLPPYWVWLYFGGLGAGFMLVEISIILRMSLFLEYPVLAFGVVLFTLLLTSGAGSLQSMRISLKRGLVILLGLLLFNVFLLPLVINECLILPLLVRVLITVLWLAPTGFFMGIPFAAGMRVLEAQTPGSIPWAWAINGAVSGLSGVLAATALLDLGFQITLLIGTLCYTLVLYTTRNWGG